MSRGAIVAAAALVPALLSGGPALADTLPPAAAGAPQQGATSLGVPYQSRSGFYLESQVGVFTAFGGEKSASNAQPWVAAQIGFEIPGLASPAGFVQGVGIFLSGGQGFNDGDCHLIDPNVGGCLTWQLNNNSSPGMSPENFEAIPLEVGGRVSFATWFPNIHWDAIAAVGYTIFAPELSENGVGGAFDLGVGLGLDYGTRLAGLTFGIEAVVRFAFISPLISYLTAYPRLQYVF